MVSAEASYLSWARRMRKAFAVTQAALRRKKRSVGQRARPKDPDEHGPSAQPVREVELLVQDRHGYEIHHEHIGLEKRRPRAEGSPRVSQVREKIQKEPENADGEKDEKRLPRPEEPPEPAVRQELRRKEHQRGRP